MINLKDYTDSLRAAVAVENDKDKNWRWGLKITSQTVAHIKWGYLEYIGEKHDFTITSSTDETLGDYLTARLPESGEMITFVVIGGRFKDVETAEQGIERMVHAIASYAHSRY